MPSSWPFSCTWSKSSSPYGFLYAEPTFFVTQTKATTLDEKLGGGRILASGAPFLYSLGTAELKSILAHEFAHFTGRGTSHSRAVLPVHRFIFTALLALQGVGGGSLASLIISACMSD